MTPTSHPTPHLGDLRSLRVSGLGTGSLSDDWWAGSGDLTLCKPPTEICLLLTRTKTLEDESFVLGPFPFLSKQRITFIWKRFTGTSLPDHDLNSRTKSLTPRSLQQLTTSLPHYSYKRALPKALGEFCVFKAWTTHLLAWPYNELFSVPDSNVLVLFGLILCWVHEFAFM